jgi:hypothetical protein
MSKRYSALIDGEWVRLALEEMTDIKMACFNL